MPQDVGKNDFKIKIEYKNNFLMMQRTTIFPNK